MTHQTTPLLQATGILKNFTKTDGSTLEVLGGIDLSLNSGETVCIVGASGCGKSTLLRILAGVDTEFHGKVNLSPIITERGFSYVLQSPHLLPWRTVLQNATIGLEIQKNLHQPTIDAVESKLQRFGLNGFENTLPLHLSGGMQQKAAIVSALSANPALLFCDEPFSSIDLVSRLQLLDTFKHQCTNEKISVIHVTHNIDEAIFLGDRVVVLSTHPARITAEFSVQLGKYAHDPIQCREASGYTKLFRDIWEALRNAL